MTTRLHRRRQTGQRSRPCPFPRLQTSSPDEENTRTLLLMFFFLTCDRFGICMGGAVGAEIDIRVWLLLLANWLGKVFYWSLKITGWKGWFCFSSAPSHLVGQVGVLVEQLAQVEHDRLPVEAGVGEDQLERLAGWTRLRCLWKRPVDNVWLWGLWVSPPSWLGYSPHPPRNRSRSHLVSESEQCLVEKVNSHNSCWFEELETGIDSMISIIKYFHQWGAADGQKRHQYLGNSSNLPTLFVIL